MTARTTTGRLQVATALYDFVNQQVLPGTGMDQAAFWAGFDAIVADLAEDAPLLTQARAQAPRLLDQHGSAARAHVARWLGGRMDYLKA